ncbi:MurR/RpiR family transcriptional regulator [Streptococcus chenjunshii]|uniref:MurR/RpiR family transcriptional regulator n=1 Tax=Streptococcus chenjunshii TaxID=2173853 RepID=A0A372KNP5_9STRE|nr:MurR/RpiR family transcriptional regulator [Streptococcus chenjunshii]AXQ77945.1 MurR/RpiR family transcriptional regulator [Streptococcus chenjunshii]RFU51811.1 MurR/RpiR family transcriptional regulator [Streptococcus chenjunshii]RFU53899.1 MurR/RpiR family transcriptional regulator [Streptococcus chenjunshii]
MNQHRLTDTEEYIWNYINEHFNQMIDLTISELSERLSVSNASVTRTLKKKGYAGFSAFKHEIQNNSRDSLHIINNQHMTADTKQSIIKNYQEVIRTLNMIDADVLEQAIAAIKTAHRIMIFARGFSEMTGSEMLIKFQLSHKYCELHTDPNIIRPVSKRLTAEDLVIFISLNGETAALVDAAKNCQRSHITSILISANPSGSLAQLTDYQLFGFKSELSYFPDFEVHSRLPLAILSRIVLDAYAASLKNQKQTDSLR